MSIDHFAGVGSPAERDSAAGRLALFAGCFVVRASASPSSRGCRASPMSSTCPASASSRRTSTSAASETLGSSFVCINAQVVRSNIHSGMCIQSRCSSPGRWHRSTTSFGVRLSPCTTNSSPDSGCHLYSSRRRSLLWVLCAPVVSAGTLSPGAWWAVGREEFCSGEQQPRDWQGYSSFSPRWNAQFLCSRGCMIAAILFWTGRVANGNWSWFIVGSSWVASLGLEMERIEKPDVRTRQFSTSARCGQ